MRLLLAPQEALAGQLESCLHMLVTNGQTIVYNHARRAKQGHGL